MTVLLLDVDGVLLHPPATLEEDLAAAAPWGPGGHWMSWPSGQMSAFSSTTPARTSRPPLTSGWTRFLHVSADQLRLDLLARALL